VSSPQRSLGLKLEKKHCISVLALAFVLQRREIKHREDKLWQEVVLVIIVEIHLDPKASEVPLETLACPFSMV
jgi:hypothetical protein